MRTDAERLEAMHKRAEEISTKILNKSKKIYYIAASLAAMAAIIALAIYMPTLNADVKEASADIGMNASMFTDSSALSYIVIGIVAFLLGVALTIFCYRIGKIQKENKKSSED